MLFLFVSACDDAQPPVQEPGELDAQTISICHTDAGFSFSLLEESQQNLPTHLLHGDGIPGGPVPGKADFAFSTICTILEDNDNGPCPKGMAHIDNFCIDRWEAHLDEHSPFEVPTEGKAQTAAGVIPQGYISGNIAEAACNVVGKRLCTSTEWLRACQGPQTLTFPYGPSHIPSACNEGRESHPVVELFGSATDWSPTQMNDPRINQLPNTLALTGSTLACMSAEGVFDLHGNLHEWVADADGTFRGGFYVDAEINGAGCLYRTTAHGRSYHDYSTGFRCCSDAK